MSTTTMQTVAILGVTSISIFMILVIGGMFAKRNQPKIQSRYRSNKGESK